MYRNRFDTSGKCAVEGNQAEDAFKKILIAQGRKFVEATIEQQHKHVDFIVDNTDMGVTKYDVKAKKRVSRRDEETNSELIWVEFLNVRGDLGWLYGDAHFIAFEREADFLVVGRAKLAEMCEAKCNLSQQVYHSEDALYKRYQRRYRDDCVSLVLASDIEALPNEVYLKI